MKIFVLAVTTLALFSHLAIAEDAKQHTIDMTIPMHDEDGSVSKHLEPATKDDPKCEKCDPITLGFTINHALNLQFRDEENLPGEQKWARSLLGERIKDDKAAALSAPEAALIEKVVEKAYPGYYIRQIIPLIDPNHRPPKVE